MNIRIGRSGHRHSHKQSRDKHSSHQQRRKHVSESSSESSDLEPEEEKLEVTEGYRLYQERKQQRRLEEQSKAAALMDGGLNLRKIDFKDFPNYKRKLVVQNIPKEVSEEEITNYFYTVLSSISKVQCKCLP